MMGILFTDLLDIALDGMPGFVHWRTSLDLALKKQSNLYWEKKSPSTYRPNKGTELKNTLFQNQLSEYEIKFDTSENDDIKATIVERFNRILNTRMYRNYTQSNSYRYVDVLQYLMHSYNHTYHSSIGMAPTSVNVKNERLVR